LASNSNNTTKCDASTTSSSGPTSNVDHHEHFTPASVAKENFQDIVNAHDIDSMPVYTAEQVAQNNGTDGTPIWMTYGGVVYDVTDFIHNHPGGSELISQAAGSAIEPFWYVLLISRISTHL
jgi:cytochrome b involved in lipid metabolism